MRQQHALSIPAARQLRRWRLRDILAPKVSVPEALLYGAYCTLVGLGWPFISVALVPIVVLALLRRHIDKDTE